MALTKRQYTDGQTIITAANLNEIQDCIIDIEGSYVPKTRTVAGKALSSNITLSASDVGAVPTSRTVNSKALSSNITLAAADVGAVPVSRTVNSKALSSNITLNAADVGAVPTTRTVNSKALSSNITLAAGDIGYNSSTTYSSSTVGKAISDLSGSTTALNTRFYSTQVSDLAELASAVSSMPSGVIGIFSGKAAVGLSLTGTSLSVSVVAKYIASGNYAVYFAFEGDASNGLMACGTFTTAGTPTATIRWRSPKTTFIVTGTTLASKSNTTFCTTAADARITANTNIASVTFLDPSVLSSFSYTATSNADGTITLSGSTRSTTTTAIIECYN